MGHTAMVMNVFYDTEFIENGSTIDLISLGAVDDQGREFYAVSTEFNPIPASDWVKENVLDKLPPRHNPAWMSRLAFRDAYYRWLTEPGEKIKLWAYYAAYDHVAYAQLWGPMIRLPKPLPMRTSDLMDIWELAGCPEKPPQPSNQHDALADAHWNKAFYDVCWSRMGILHGPHPEALIRPGHGVVRGEHGPERIALPEGATVHSNDQTRKDLEGLE